MAITPLQNAIYNFIRDCCNERSIPPTITEIGEKFGLKSKSNVSYHLDALQHAGLLYRLPRRKRGIVLNQPSVQTGNTGMVHLGAGNFGMANASSWEVPLRGIVAAGRPVEAVLVNESITVPTAMAKPGADIFALRVRGDSMRDEHILDGDIIIIKAQPVAHNGQKVVALLDGSETTVKKYFRKQGAVRLEPANPEFETIVITPPRTIEIQGIVTGLLRFG